MLFRRAGLGRWPGRCDPRHVVSVHARSPHDNTEPSAMGRPADSDEWDV